MFNHRRYTFQASVFHQVVIIKGLSYFCESPFISLNMSDEILKSGYLAIGSRLRQLLEKLYADGDRVYANQGIEFKTSWFSVFYRLSFSKTPKTVVALANEIGFSHITIKNVLRELQSAQLVEISMNPLDKRSKHVVLSVQGRQLLGDLQKIWGSYAQVLKRVLDTGHPDFINIIKRIEDEIAEKPIHTQLNEVVSPSLQLLDYHPLMKEKYTLLLNKHIRHLAECLPPPPSPFQIIQNGGFVWLALLESKPVGALLLERNSHNSFEINSLILDPQANERIIATKLLGRCLTRCHENNALIFAGNQTTPPLITQLYMELGIRRY